MTIVLASTSRARIDLLRHAGIVFESIGAPIDERLVEAPLLASGATPTEIAIQLADAKAMAVSALRPGDLIIGSDQVLDFDGQRFVKPADMADAARQIGRLAGRSHFLHSSVSIARHGSIVWRHQSTATMTMRPLDAAAIDRYIAEAGEDILWSVGGYLLESTGIQLFSAIDGDYFSILGLPLLPLLGALRAEGAIES
jgi:septum formation protein